MVMELKDVGTLIAAVVLAVSAGGGGVHVWNRARSQNGKTGGSNGYSSHAEVFQAEILRQNLHDQRHGETMRVIADVAETSANAAKASERAAHAAERAAASTERLGAALERHLEVCR